MAKRVLITGVNGFAASHLARALVLEGCEVHGTIRVRSDLSKIADLNIHTHLVELTDAFSVDKVIRDVLPEEVYHLAAQSYVKSSWDSPLETYRINTEGTINVLEAVRKHASEADVLICSTSEIYGEAGGEIDEDTLPNPNTHYGISKYAQDLIGSLYHRAFGLHTIMTRSFNVTGPGRADVFVDSSFAKQVALIEKGKQDKIQHGNLQSERDFVDVRDVVLGYISALRSGLYGEAICFGSGEPRKIQEVLDILLGLSTKPDIIAESDPSRFRPVDTKTMKCNYSKAERLLGWNPVIPLEESLEDLLNYWRERV